MRKKVYPPQKGRIEYITILKLVLDTFVIKCKNRTRKKAAQILEEQTEFFCTWRNTI